MTSNDHDGFYLDSENHGRHSPSRGHASADHGLCLFQKISYSRLLSSSVPSSFPLTALFHGLLYRLCRLLSFPFLVAFFLSLLLLFFCFQSWELFYLLTHMSNAAAVGVSVGVVF